MKSTRIFSFIVTMLIVSPALVAQQNIVYNHYFFNPFLYNPSFITPHEQTELFLDYRRQWVGIQDAPSTASINLQVPINYKMSLAGTAIQDNVGVLRSTTGMIAFGYHIYLGNNAETGHKIGFGISAGISNNRIDMSKVSNPNDPALAGNSTSSMTGQFGMHYQFRKFKAGFALPSIFKKYIVSEENFNKPGIDQLSTTLTTLSYAFPIMHRVSFEPTLLYRTEKNLRQIEGMGVFQIDDLLWIGGAYRQQYGASAFFRINIKNKLKVGYGYEFATGSLNRFNNASHEVQLVFNLGKKKLTPVTKTETALEDENPVTEQEQQAPIPVEEKIVKEPVPATATPVQESTIKLTPEQELRQLLKKDLSPKKLNGEYLATGYYIVVGVFHSVLNANKYHATLKKAGYPAEIGFYPPMDNYIIYMKKTATIEEAKVARDAYRARSRYSFKDTWIFFVK
jgi:type IX secretion system PorP/SprF family membrane protein